jgi:hypothetical protein
LALESSIQWVAIKQDLPRPALPDPARRLRDLLAQTAALSHLKRGDRVAVALGSRGIRKIAELAREVVSALKERGLQPFVVPAMGSHGGGTPAEQRSVLAQLGIDEGALGVPVVSTDAVTCIGETPSGIPVWVDAEAWSADAILPVNRVKPHTAFRGQLESGPSKLLAVGLGKRRSAEALHRVDLATSIPEVTSFLLASGRAPLGVAMVENAFGDIAELEVLEAREPGGWIERESRLLDVARKLLAKLPWDDIDLLVIEQVGKDISGTGMDLHVIGLERRFPGSGALPRVRRIVALDLTEHSRGNATGIGYADVVTRALADKIDWEPTYANCRTTGFLDAARLPLVADGEEAAIRTALESLPWHARSPETVRAARIRDTAHLNELWVSPRLAL